MIEINLVPDVKQELLKAQRIRSLVIIGSIIAGSVSVGIVALLAIYIFGVQSIRSNLYDDSIKKENAKLVNVKDLSKTLTIQNQLTKITSLNNNKKIGSRIFDVIAAINPPAPNDIKISDLTVNPESESIIINGQASNSYNAVETFKKTINGAMFRYTDSNKEKQEVPLASDISTSDTSYGEDSTNTKVLRFTITFKYANELFALNSNNASIAIAIDGNVTDSYLGVPKSVFTDAAKALAGNNK